MNVFEIVFLDEAFEFLKSLERKHYEKILYNIRKVPDSEIEKAIKSREKYFEDKQLKNKKK